MTRSDQGVRRGEERFREVKREFQGEDYAAERREALRVKITREACEVKITLQGEDYA